MNRKLFRDDTASVPDDISSKKNVLTEGKSSAPNDKEHQVHDDGEYFEFELFKVFKIKCKRVTKNVIIVITILILAVPILYYIFKT